jgi:hypothetical protein
LLEEKKYIVRSGAVLNSILDMRKRKHSLQFMVDGEILPHAIVNITDNENIHIGVCYIILFCSYIYLFIFYYLFIYIIYYIQFSSRWKVTITLLNISLLSLPPPFPNTRCIAYNFDGSNVNDEDFSMLRYEDGKEIQNINDYLKEGYY